MKNIYTLFVIALLFMAIQAKGQGYLKADGKNIVNENGETVILRGMGLGGWMLQEGYMLQTAGFANAQHKIRARIEDLIGKEDTDLFYDAWLANHVRKGDIDSLKAWGFNSVRLPMHYNLFTLPIEEEPVAGENTWLTKGFEMTDSLISWCKQNELYVILDLHAAPGGQGKDEGISDYDPNKPSLWESEANQAKTVALWKKLAETYVNEPWIGGYDLINETNWEMQNNAPLKQIYLDITAAIREVDTKHIIFIEGNWFANDFTNLTPPWDDNLVYSPHKYWSINDQTSIQWVLDLRDAHNVPLYFGEWGENSNAWFKDAIDLFERNGIGWAVWPMKKIESIAGPLSIVKTPEYQILLDCWNGIGAKPSAAFAKAALMEMTEGLKIENCIYQKDVIDAMFRQQTSVETVPFNTQKIPGVVYATDYDMGVVGAAYYDTDIADFRVSTGNFTAWNSGWTYRNDGVDIEKTEDNVSSNGYNVGWTANDEWMQYDVDVAESGVYAANVRVASGGDGGQFHFAIGEGAISPIVEVTSTDGWQNWQTVTATNIVLTPADKKIRFYIDAGGINVNSFEFVRVSDSDIIPTEFVAANTLDDQTIQLSLNKRLAELLNASSDFKIFVNGNAVSIIKVQLDPNNPRVVTFTVNQIFRSEDVITISYEGNQIKAEDGTDLNLFTRQPVQNKVAIIHAIPGRVQAEDYIVQSGIQLENTSDIGGGKNVGFLDNGDYMDYLVNVTQAGNYEISFRTAAQSEMGAIEIQLIDDNGNARSLENLTFPSTGGWQTWTNTTTSVSLPAGQLQLRIVIAAPLFNINWFEFSFLTNTENVLQVTDFQLFPNPVVDMLSVKGTLEKSQTVELKLVNVLGQTALFKNLGKVTEIQQTLSLEDVPNGAYMLVLQAEDGQRIAHKVVKNKE